MRRRSGRRVLFSMGDILSLTGVLSLLSCQVTPMPSRGAAGNGKTEGEEVSIARWHYHPRKKAPSTGTLALGGGETLEVDEAGTRWLLEPTEKPKSSIVAAPEPLLGLKKVGEQFLALGQGGSVYFFAQPLGAFEEVRTPPVQFARSQFSESGILAVGVDGTLSRSSDWGRSWKRLQEPGFFVHFLETRPGELLALSVPERWLRSLDEGESFEPLSIEPVAPRSILKKPFGEVVVEGLYHRYVYRDGKLKRSRRAKTQTRGYPLLPRASASAISQGHAVLLGSEYRALRQTNGNWELLSGALDRALVVEPASGLPPCASYRFAQNGGFMAVACVEKTEQGVAPAFSLFRARAGEKFKPVKAALRGSLAKLQFVMSARGTLAFAGLCPPHESEQGCSASGVVLFDKNNTLSLLDVPGVLEPDALAWDQTGGLWVVGVRKKDGHVVVAHTRPKKSQTRLWDLTRESDFPAHVRLVLSLHPGREDLVSAIARARDDVFIATLSAAKDSVTTARAPVGTRALAGAAGKLLALNPKDGFTWESLSGGLSWSRRALPRSPCSETDPPCKVSLVCAEGGCLVGDELSRIGWGKDGVRERVELPRRNGGEVSLEESSALVCRLTSAKWKELPGLVSAPTAGDSGYGSVAWAQTMVRRETASAVSVHAPWGGDQLKKKELLPPVSDGSRYAQGYSSQIEGAAVIRYLVPSRKALSQANSVEVAWDNRVTDRIGSGTLTRSFGRHPMNIESGRSAKPPLMSVAGDGLFLELLDASSVSRNGYFFTGSGGTAQVREVGVRGFPQANLTQEGWFARSGVDATSRRERISVHGQLEELLLLAGSRVMVRAWQDPRRPGQTTYTPYLMGLLRDHSSSQAQGVSISYLGSQVGFVSMQVDVAGKAYQAHYVGLGENRAFEAPLPVPLQADLGRKPRFCTPADHRATPRVVAPSVPGPKRSVRVFLKTGKPVSLEMGGAVLYGSKQDACVAAWEATESPSGNDRHGAIVIPSSDQFSWLFRRSTGVNGVASIAARPMKCAYE